MSTFQSIDITSLSAIDRHQYMTSLVAPRPIAFVSTVSKAGVRNLAPFSYFTALSSTPPIVGFSCNVDMDGTEKDTLVNIRETGECVINMVSHDIVEQMVHCSNPYDPTVDEFAESGLTPIASDLVNPPRVGESKAQLECHLKEILNWSSEPGASHFIICDVIRIHCRESDYLKPHRLDPHKLDQVGRLGRKYYTRVNGNIWEV